LTALRPQAAGAGGARAGRASGDAHAGRYGHGGTCTRRRGTSVPDHAARNGSTTNGEDYDEPVRGHARGFHLDEVSEPAIDTQLAWFKKQSRLSGARLPARPALHVTDIITEVERRGMPPNSPVAGGESAYEPSPYGGGQEAWSVHSGHGVR